MHRSNPRPARRFWRRDERVPPHAMESYRDRRCPKGAVYCETSGKIHDGGRRPSRAIACAAGSIL